MIGVMQGRLTPKKNGLIQSFPWDNWKNEIRLLKLLNIKQIEWTLDFPNLFKNPLLSCKKSLDETKKFLANNKIKCNSITCDFYMQKPFFMKKFHKEEKTFINIIRLLKNEYFTLVIPLVDKSSIKNKKNEDNVINFFCKIKKNLGNLKIAFEIDYTPAETLRFISNFDKKYFGINYDSGNSAGLGHDINEEFKLYSNRITNIHIKDKNYKNLTVKLGNGNCNFKLLFENIKKIKYKKNIILQTARSDNLDDIQELIENENFIKKFLK